MHAMNIIPRSLSSMKTTCLSLNDEYPAIIFADACSNSDTDDLNIGQAMLKQGAVGFLGSTKVAYGMQGGMTPMMDQVSRWITFLPPVAPQVNIHKDKHINGH